MIINHTKCLICGSEKLAEVNKCTDYLVSHREFSIAKCSVCGFMFTQGIPTPENINSYYESPDYISHTGGRNNVTDLLYRMARNIMLNRKSRVVKGLTLKKKGTLLDIGAGTGHFVRKMKKCGWDASGVEVSESARQYALENNKVALTKDFTEDSFKPSIFDAVTLWHVLEHIYNPEEYIQIISSILKPGGMLFIALPNPSSADARHYREKWAAYDVPRHLWHFNASNIETLVTKYGFRSVAISRMPFDSFYIPVLSEKNRNSPIPLIPGLIKGFFFWFQSLVKREKSSSLNYVFRKV